MELEELKSLWIIHKKESDDNINNLKLDINDLNKQHDKAIKRLTYDSIISLLLVIILCFSFVASDLRLKWESISSILAFSLLMAIQYIYISKKLSSRIEVNNVLLALKKRFRLLIQYRNQFYVFNFTLVFATTLLYFMSWPPDNFIIEINIYSIIILGMVLGLVSIFLTKWIFDQQYGSTLNKFKDMISALDENSRRF